MIEKRALVKNLEKTKTSIEELGAEFKSNYIFRDIIFVPKIGKYNLDDDVVRARIYIKSDWPTKKVVLIRKKTEWTNEGKTSIVTLKKEFDKEEDALDFIKESLSDFKKGFEYEREGWQYEIDGCRIFLEDIKGYNSSIEIESNDENELQKLLKKLGINKFLQESVPEMMRKILEKE